MSKTERSWDFCPPWLGRRTIDLAAEVARKVIARSLRGPLGAVLDPRDDLDRTNVELAVQVAQNYSDAARVLGVPRTTLRDAATRYGIASPNKHVRRLPPGIPPWNGQRQG